MYHPDTNSANPWNCNGTIQETICNKMEEIFIQALVTRSKMEDGLIDLLPEEVKTQVQELLTTEVQDVEVVE